MSIDVSIVLVTYNSRTVVGNCLDSIKQHTSGVAYEAIVVDNDSSDGTSAFVAREYPWAQLLRRPKNGGLSAAINDGVAMASGRNIAVLNPDTRFESDVLATLSGFLDAHAGVGVVAPRLVDDDGTLQMSCRAFPGYATAMFNRYSVLTRLLPGNRYSRDYLMSDFDHASARDVDWVSGAALMLPRRIFNEVGGWDAGYFMFNEDVDLCKRVHAAGYPVVYNPAATVRHAIGVSKSRSARLIVERHRSMWRYYRKHLRGGILRDGVTAAGIAARCGVLLLATSLRTVATRVRVRG